MRRAWVAVTFSFLLSGCGGQDERSPAAREALAAVEELRGLVNELETLSTKAAELQEKAIAKGITRDGGDGELEALHQRVNAIKERAQRSVRTIAPDLDRKIEKDPKDAGLLDARSRFRETVGSVDEALVDLDAARAILPKDASLRARRPGLLRRLGRYEEARAVCADLLKEEPGHPVALAVDGLCLYALNSFPDAVARLGEAAAKEGRLEPSLGSEVKRSLEAAKTKKDEWAEELEKRAAEAKADDLPRVKLATTRGDIVVELFENEAPNAVASFIDLCDKKFYDGTLFHRVIPDFMVQGGDPLSRDKNPRNDGTGDPGYKFADEFPPTFRRHFRGVLALANNGKDTNGCQFYITHRPTEHLDGKHVVFGRVIEGMSVVDAIRKGDAVTTIEILRKRPHAYRPVY
jgi:cyclophilin family peptidyl-prolyl cis-trans isomerase/Flp pilus assembly protein TadD